MLTFVQVYRTRDKVLYLNKVLKEQIKSKRNIIWSLRRSWRLALLKTCAPEEYDVIRSWRPSEASSLEATVFHQKQNNSRFYDLSVVFWSKSHIELAEDQWNNATVILKGFEVILAARKQEALILYSVRTVQPPSPLLCSVSQLPDKNNSSHVQPSLHLCSLSTGIDRKSVV